MPRLVLASASPRRLELLERFYPPERITVIVPEYDEYPLMNNTKADTASEPAALAGRLAAGKLAALLEQNELPTESLVIAADTIVTIDEKMLGKPETSREAAEMLRLLSNRTHKVVTGLAIQIRSGGSVKQRIDAETTEVTFGLLDEAMIEWYLASGEPYDKAGAYGIQGLGAAFISGINGCYYNVMGLPVHRLFAELKEMAATTGSVQMRSFILPFA
ncbi:MAG: septum formation protein Maf [Ruminococcaceae bacterium]|nr:septum formation protein Maf [Oscillospiraceae bacterium]